MYGLQQPQACLQLSTAKDIFVILWRRKKGQISSEHQGHLWPFTLVKTRKEQVHFEK